MSVTMKITLSDALHAAAVARAKADGQAFGEKSGVQVVMRKALRTYLNQNGFKREHLDLTDAEYQIRKANRTAQPPGARNPQNGAPGESR